jgi:hypothetical protein
LDVCLSRCLRAFALLLTCLLVLVACSADDTSEAPDDEVAGERDGPDREQVAGAGDDEAAGAGDEEDAGSGGDGGEAGAGSDGDGDGSQDHLDDTEATSVARIDPAEVGADELGQVPVLMYHQLKEDGGSEWDMSPEEFRAELELLFDAGYVPIRAIDLARGQIDIPAGARPVVLTFDDSTRSQARLDDDGEIADDTKIGILIDVAERYEDVEPIASIYVITSSLFGGGSDDEDILRALADLGMELGNHSHTHQVLRGLSADGVQEELATNVDVVTSIVPDAEVATLSLPLGMFPDDDELAVRGEWGGTSYEHEGVLLVGYNPAPSPFHVEFDASAIPRIQTHPDPEFQFGSAWWFEQLERGEGTRPYVSDGDPDTISFPEERADELDPAHEDRANPY